MGLHEDLAKKERVKHAPATAPIDTTFNSMTTASKLGVEHNSSLGKLYQRVQRLAEAGTKRNDRRVLDLVLAQKEFAGLKERAEALQIRYVDLTAEKSKIVKLAEDSCLEYIKRDGAGIPSVKQMSSGWRQAGEYQIPVSDSVRRTAGIPLTWGPLVMQCLSAQACVPRWND